MIDSLAILWALAGLAYVVWRIVSLERRQVVEQRKAQLWSPVDSSHQK
jgi:hypothetical protein